MLCSARRRTGLVSCSCHAPSAAVGEVRQVRFRFVTARFSSASFSHSAPGSEIPTKISALADPKVVDGSKAGFVHSLDPTMLGMYNCIFSALAS